MLPKSRYRHALNDYSEATSEASKRTRSMALLLIFASAITLIGLRNSMDSGYFIRGYEDLHTYWKLAVNDSSVVMAGLGSDSPVVDFKPAFKDTLLLRAKYPFLASRKIYTLGDYKSYEELYRTTLKEAYLVHIPILGMAFHINDLSIVSSLAFAVLLLIFYFFLISEEDALVQLFFKASQTDKNLKQKDGLPDEVRSRSRPYLRHYYKLHSVRQVLTVTPDSVLGKQPLMPGLAKAFSYFLLLLPALSCFAVLRYDEKTSAYGHGNDELMLATIATGFVIVLNLYCCYVAYKSDATWTHYHAIVREARAYEKSMEQTLGSGDLSAI